MTGSRTRPTILIAGLLLGLLAVTLQGVQGEELEKIPSEDQCRPYIEKALKDLGTEGSQEEGDGSEGGGEADDDGDDDSGPGDEATDDTEQLDESGNRVKRDISADEDGEDDGNEKDDDNDGDDTAENEVDQDQEDTVEVTSAEDADQDDNGTVEVVDGDETADSKEDDADTKEEDGEESKEQEGEQTAEAEDADGDSGENKTEEEGAVVADEESGEQKDGESAEQDDGTKEDDDGTKEEDDGKTEEEDGDDKSTEDGEAQAESGEEEAKDDDTKEAGEGESGEDDKKSVEEETISAEDAGASVEQGPEADDGSEEAKEGDEKSGEDGDGDSKADNDAEKSGEEAEGEADGDSKEGDADGDSKEGEADGDSKEGEAEGDSKEGETEVDSKEEADGDTKEDDETGDSKDAEAEGDSKGDDEGVSKEGEGDGDSKEGETDADTKEEGDSKEGETDADTKEEGDSKEGESKEGDDDEDEASRPEEEELIMEIEIPEILRPRDHIGQLLKLDEDNEVREKAVEKVSEVVLKDLKRLYDNAIKPLETLYKYRDLSNRHFGDPEIFSKPLVLFMGPWSGGKSSIINYLLDIEYKPTSLRTGAEPSPAYFNILMHGEEEEILDGTQLAADWTFSGLQKFGQGLLDRLKGYKLKNKLLEKVNIVEIPGILEIRKQVQRLFPFNDACQWFIDRADIIFLVYDPSKLDVGPETEAILDQLKGREYQTRIILNKADQVKPEELMRVQGALIWNISPLMSSAEPPIMYSTSLWSIPYEAGAPTRLLYAQERAFLRDLRSAVEKRVEHKIASARRFAVRVRNHAKMVDCYLTTYYNHKSFFSKKKDISDRIIENPQDYHIYEGLSTLTNISRYDLPDPDVYRDFFRLNQLYDFPLLSSTCTYFRGCPINRLDVAIAYDLPELVGKYKKSVETAVHQDDKVETPAAVPTPQAQQQQKARSGASRMTMS